MLSRILHWFGVHTYGADRLQHTHDEDGNFVPEWTDKDGNVLTTYKCIYCDYCKITWEPKDEETE